MEFIHILPTNMINEDMMRQKYEMYLTDQILKNKEKYSFLAKDSIKGENYYKILDNSAFELGEGLTMEKVLEAAKIIDATEIILPDIVNSTESFNKTLKALSELDTKNLKYKIAAVVQGDNWTSRTECMKKLLSIKCIKTIMIPKVCEDRNSLVEILSNLKVIYDRPDIEIHLLGLRNEGISELMYPDIKKKVRSIDTGYFMAISNDYRKDVSEIDPRPRDLTIDLNSMVIDREMFNSRIKAVKKILEL